MTIQQKPPGLFTLWSVAHSLYAGKARAYLIKKGVPFRELYPPHPGYRARAVAAAKVEVIPILETPEGEFIQDTTDIIEFVEARFSEPQMIPDTPVQRAVAWLLEAFGSEYLLPLAMHYRWSYRTEQETFLRAEFGRVTYAGPDREAARQSGQRYMDYFSGFLPALGVTPETIPALETSYAELLNALDVHLQRFPYLLGGRPSVADFGLMAPMFAHLGRDPVPAGLMKTTAPNVFRWTERMNRSQISDGEFFDLPETYFPNDEIPPSLEAVLALVFKDWGPELAANMDRFSTWLKTEPRPSAGQIVSRDGLRRVHPSLGWIHYDWNGQSMRRASAPHTLWHFDRAADHARGLEGEAKRRFSALARRTGGELVMSLRLPRPLKREDSALVLG
ncbi:glutathione S-transferase family protein [Bradyrhizobium erythrophlei]|uniref:Glutathione S-transferase n=1 Tax=Bradyrhizobium erythrophlei TaxID=1437360 RepID=A0A1H4WWM3_9BRAD|nr:glutathione S-transferase family protein [Bradyrhizobium erythrophlei]SEC97713.1 Glutathione S-transferase [Bradyrhizobium erythrophlei]